MTGFFTNLYNRAREKPLTSAIRLLVVALLALALLNPSLPWGSGGVLTIYIVDNSRSFNRFRERVQAAILADAPNCVNCGAGAPPPPPPSAKGQPNTWQRVATGLLWYFGGIIGLHCYAAGRPLRGLFYFTTFIAMFFIMTSYTPGGTLGGLSTFGPLTIGFGLFLLWAFDGVQILRGRFNR